MTTVTPSPDTSLLGQVEQVVSDLAGDAAALPGQVEQAVANLAGDASFAPLPNEPAREARRWWGHPIGEYRWQLELARLLADPVYRGAGVPRGNGAPVLLIPGFLAGDASLSVMHGWLERMGHRPHYAGIRMNVDCSDRALDRLEAVLVRTQRESGQRVALVGHSRGGHFAKVLAVRRPELVSQVVSLGSGLDEPFDISIPTRLAVSGVRSVLVGVGHRAADAGCLTTSCRCPFARDFSSRVPANVPVTSVYSKGDGVVWWEACVVPWARNVEVTGSHVGLAFNRKAYRVIAETLAAPARSAAAPVTSEAPASPIQSAAADTA